MNRYCLCLDLKNEPALIAAYDKYHQNVWPEIISSIKNSGIVAMDIYRTSNRLVMIVETTDAFSWEAKSIADQQNEKVKEWESLMWNYQQALPGAAPGQKWILMDKVFSL